MPEEGNAPAPTETPPAGTPAAPVALADDKGVLREGWLESLDEGLRGEAFLAEVKDVQSMAKSAVNARRMVGKDKMVRPTAESSEEDWDEYYKAGGKPDTALDYGFKRPDDFPEEHYHEEFALGAMELFHKLGISKKQADGIFKFNNDFVLKAVQAQAAAQEFELARINNELDTDWGLARDQKMHLGNIAIAEAVKDKNGIVNEEYKARLLEKVNKDPDLIRLVSNLGSKFSEHGIIHDTGIPTPAVLDARIDEEKHKKSYGPDYVKHGFTKQEHKRQVEVVRLLFEEKMKSVKTG